MYKILVIDDEERIVDIIEKYLSMNGFEVIKVIGSEEAVKILNSNPTVDMMVLDMKMPKVSGMDIIKKTKELGKNFPILVLTGSINAEEYFDEFKNSGFPKEDILYKPVDLPILLEKVKEKLHLAIE